MPFIDTIPMERIDENVRAMYARQQNHYGYVPGYAKIFSHRPELMKLWADLLSGIKRNLDLRRYELVTFVASLALRSTPCALAHGAALTRFLSQGDVEAIARGELPASLSDADRAVVSFARKVGLDASSVTRADADELRRHGLTDPEIFDVAATAAARAFWTKINDSLGVEPDEPLAAKGPGFVAAVALGRAPAFVGTERLEER